MEGELPARERELEMAEYQAIQTSRFFSGDTNSARFLRFVCQRHFSGVDHVSEKEVAIEGLGRRSDFDPQQDSIVRVEAHRVRKRLREYYEAEGARHPVRLTIPQGTYVPHFVPVSGPQKELDATLDLEEEGEAESIPSPLPGIAHQEIEAGKETGFRLGKMQIAAMLLVAVALVGSAPFFYPHRQRESQASSPSYPVAEPSAPVSATLPTAALIMAGSSAKSYTDQLGHVWSEDQYYKGGESWVVPYRRISRTDDPQLFLTARQGSDFGYEIPLERGIYELRLYFSETFFGEGNREGGGESSRIFDVTANGKLILTDFDPLSDAGGSNTADVRVFSGLSPAEDGKLHLEFRSKWQLKSVAFVNAIEILRTGARPMSPIRWVAANSAIEDSAGNLWIPDQFVQGGRRRELTEVVTNTGDPELYKSERYGNFSYAIPVSENDTYSLTLHFSEHWFGIPDYGGPPDTAAGKRVFDVYCNGVYLLQNYDVFKEAGGSLRAVSVTFHGLKPNHQGKIQLNFVPARHYASIDAIEIRSEHGSR
jgi:hypothetical protein